MDFTIKMGNNKMGLYVQMDPAKVQVLKDIGMFDVLCDRFFGSGAAKKLLHEKWEAFRQPIQEMMGRLSEKNRNYAVNHGTYPMERVFMAKTYEAFMTEVADAAIQDDSIFENKFSGLLTATVFERWLTRLGKTADKVLGTVFEKKAELYAVILTKNLEKARDILKKENKMDDEREKRARIVLETSAVRQCISAEKDAKLIDAINNHDCMKYKGFYLRLLSEQVEIEED